MVKKAASHVRVDVQSTYLKQLLTQDYFPDFSSKFREFVAAPIGWLSLSALLTAICAICISPQVWAIFVCLLGMIAVGLFWPWMTLRTMQFSLAFARDRIVEGEPIRVTARLTNCSIVPAYGLSLRGDLRTNGDENPSGSELAALLPFCGGWREVECNWIFAPPHRGIYPLSAPCLRTGFPFGLWEAKRKSDAAASLIVWPATFPVGAVPISNTDALLDGNVSRNRAGSEGELMGVRPYRRGDSPRRIHWAKTARHDRLIVCERESTARPTLRIVLDLDSSVHTSGIQGSFEWSIRIAASFAKGWIEAGAQVSLLADQVDLPLAGGQLQIRRILDVLAKLSRTSNRSLVEVMRPQMQSCGSAGVSVVITTDLRNRDQARNDVRDIRWVVLRSRQFSHGPLSGTGFWNETSDGSGLRAAWLNVDSPDQARYALRNGWSEARHGS
jgi:uncharacterized protein (DUF58 family)